MNYSRSFPCWCYWCIIVAHASRYTLLTPLSRAIATCSRSRSRYFRYCFLSHACYAILCYCAIAYLSRYRFVLLLIIDVFSHAHDLTIALPTPLCRAIAHVLIYWLLLTSLSRAIDSTLLMLCATLLLCPCLYLCYCFIISCSLSRAIASFICSIFVICCSFYTRMPYALTTNPRE